MKQEHVALYGIYFDTDKATSEGPTAMALALIVHGHDDESRTRTNERHTLHVDQLITSSGAGLGSRCKSAAVSPGEASEFPEHGHTCAARTVETIH